MPSFDVVSEVNIQEVKNAVDQVQRELGTRYDFKGSKSSVALDEKLMILTIIADDKMKLAAVQDLLKQKLSKRGVSPKQVEFKDPEPAASDTLRQQVILKQGLKEEELKRLNKAVKASGLKVTSQIQGSQLRVMGKKRDDLQSMISHFRKEAADLELQFTNFRE